MFLELYDKDDNLLCNLDNDDSSLRCYNVQDGMRVHVSIEYFLSACILVYYDTLI